MTDYLQQARERVAARYKEGSVVQRGILGGQWDNGDVIRQAIKEIQDEQRQND